MNLVNDLTPLISCMRHPLVPEPMNIQAVMEEFADSLNVAHKSLSKSQRRQAILEHILANALSDPHFAVFDV